MNNYTGVIRIRFIGYFLSFFLIVTFFNGCRSSEQLARSTTKPGYQTVLDTSTVLNRAFTGFVLYDPATHKMICQRNAGRYFTPASNNKLFTFYTALVTLRDSLPGLQYVQHGDSLIFQGTGDPAFLYSVFKQQPIFKFLTAQTDSLYFDPDNFDATPLGPGWSWDDLNYYYAPERTPFPIYGNVARFQVRKITNYDLALSDSTNDVIPRSLQPNVRYASPDSQSSDFVVRSLGKNQFTFYPRNDTTHLEVEVPFHYTPKLFAEMLGDTLHKKIGIVHGEFSGNPKTVYGVPADSLYRHMLLPSDNFIAEHLLLMCSQARFGRMAPDSIIQYMKHAYLKDLPDPVIWVDGSGLSRYNLETPRNMVTLLQKINKILPDSTLFRLLPTGGVSGTLKHWYKADKPYVFGKTGTLSNNHNLSGYIITKSGRKLIFSLMVNHYVVSTSTVRRAMQNLLEAVHNDL